MPRAPASIRPARAPAASSAQFGAAAQTSATTEKESATAKLLKAIEGISEESLQLPDPNPNASKSLQFSDVSSPRSGGSPFSLGRFPLPPALPSGKSESDMPTMREQRDSGADPAVDAEFEFVAPRRPDARLQSFPSTTRGSDVGLSLSISPDAGPSDALQVDRYQYQGREITSFIGGGVTGAERESTSRFPTIGIFLIRQSSLTTRLLQERLKMHELYPVFWAAPSLLPSLHAKLGYPSGLSRMTRRSNPGFLQAVTPLLQGPRSRSSLCRPTLVQFDRHHLQTPAPLWLTIGFLVLRPADHVCNSNLTSHNSSRDRDPPLPRNFFGC